MAMTSSPLRGDASLAEQLDWYKTQYGQLETDLADFQASSKELEEQLEKDVETAERNERKWKEQVEKLNFEVDEWKTKHKQAKAEANTAQNALQKEITTMRETNRTLQLKLRDVEVVNDDYERQARNTESSLEDMESKYNVAIERGVLLEEEMKQGEQEREGLRIETQRLRDELGDLKVENEITLEKLRLAEETIEGLRARKPSPLMVESLRARSPASEASGITPLSPTASTPPPKSDSASDAPTPPSPPLSDAPPGVRAEPKTPMPMRKQQLVPDSTTPRPSLYGSRAPPRHSRGVSVATATSATTSSAARSSRPTASRAMRQSTRPVPPENLPRPDSLHQIRGLIGRMQKIEERVHSARSKLPPPHSSTPRGSPRTGAGMDNIVIPSSVTVRRSTKRPSTTSSATNDNGDGGSSTRRESHVKRLSYGIPRPSSVAANRTDIPDRPPSAMDRPPSAASRPSSRLSVTSASHRPGSRTGARTAEPGHYSNTSSATDDNSFRPRSSIGGSYGTGHGGFRTHRPSASGTDLRLKASEGDDSVFASTPRRRTTLDKTGLPLPSALPTPSGASRRQSGGIPQPASKPTNKRLSHSIANVREEDGLEDVSSDSRSYSRASNRGNGEMGPPPSRKRVSEVGETY